MSLPLKKGLLSAGLLLLLASGVCLRLHFQQPAARSLDEGIYNAYAKTLAVANSDGVAALVTEYNANSKYWIFPPPIRAGYLYLVAKAMVIGRSDSLRVAPWVSFGFSVASLCLLLLTGLRFFNPQMTLAALFFMAFSPLELALAQRGWPDGVLNFCGALLLYSSCEILVSEEKIWRWALFFVAGFFAPLIKESGFIYLSLTVIALSFFLLKERRVRDFIKLIATGFLSASAAILVLIMVSGGAVPFFELIRHTASAIPTNAYAVRYQTGPWYTFLESFWIIAPTMCIFTIAGVRALYQGERGVRTALQFFAVMLAAWGILFTLAPYSKNIRYLSPAYSAAYWLSGAGLWVSLQATYLWMRSKSTFVRKFVFVMIFLCLSAALSFGQWRDVLRFKVLFIENQLTDLVNDRLKEML